MTEEAAPGLGPGVQDARRRGVTSGRGGRGRRRGRSRRAPRRPGVAGSGLQGGRNGGEAVRRHGHVAAAMDVAGDAGSAAGPRPASGPTPVTSSVRRGPDGLMIPRSSARTAVGRATAQRQDERERARRRSPTTPSRPRRLAGVRRLHRAPYDRFGRRATRRGGENAGRSGRRSGRRSAECHRPSRLNAVATAWLGRHRVETRQETTPLRPGARRPILRGRLRDRRPHRPRRRPRRPHHHPRRDEDRSFIDERGPHPPNHDFADGTGPPRTARTERRSGAVGGGSCARGRRTGRGRCRARIRPPAMSQRSGRWPSKPQSHRMAATRRRCRRRPHRRVPPPRSPRRQQGGEQRTSE